MEKLKSRIIFAIASVVIVFGLSFAAEYLLRSRGFSVRNFIDVSIAVVGVQATMFTLVVALLALISGDKDEYLGYGIKEFYFNYSALIKQENLIIVGVLFVPLNVMFLYMNKYNAVFSVFLFSLALILYSLYRVYKIFGGSKNKFERDVELYVDKLNDDQLLDLLPRFLNDWKQRIYAQGVNEFETYANTFKRMTFVAFPKCESRNKLNDLCVEMVKTLLRDNRSSVYGMRVLYLTYLDIQELVNKNKEISIEKGSPFILYGRVVKDVLNAFRNIDMNVLQSFFSWLLFSKNVLRTNALFEDLNDSEIQYERECIIYFGGLVGRTLVSLKSQEKRAWYSQISTWIAISKKDKEQSYLFSRCIFSFLRDQFYYDANHVLRTEYYATHVNRSGCHSECVVYTTLLFHCYLWYVEEESETYISDNVKKMCNIVAEYGKDYFGPMLRMIFSNDENFTSTKTMLSVNVFDKTLLSKMNESLNAYEVYLDGVVKEPLMENVVEEFILFCLIYMCSLPCLNPLERFYGKENLSWLYAEYNQDEYRSKFKRFCSLLLPDTVKADEMYTIGMAYLKGEFTD